MPKKGPKRDQFWPKVPFRDQFTFSGTELYTLGLEKELVGWWAQK